MRFFLMTQPGMAVLSPPAADDQATATLRVYVAGDVPSGLWPHQYDGIDLLQPAPAPPPQATIMI